MKFSVAPESSRAVASVLFAAELKYTRIDIDRRFERYTRSEPCDLIQTVRIRPFKNPAPGLPTVLSAGRLLPPSGSQSALVAPLLCY